MDDEMCGASRPLIACFSQLVKMDQGLKEVSVEKLDTNKKPSNRDDER
jgi:hypothetical protein